jgi:nucleoside-diphosphate-sugar epimerase
MALFTILGASGFIGSHLVRQFRGRGHDIFAPARDEPIFNRHLGHVIYCIGMTTDFSRYPLKTAEAHVCALVPVLRYAQFDKLVYLSSVRLYDGVETAAASETAELRFNTQNSRHLYGFSKALGEMLVLYGGRPGAIMRLGSVFDDKLAEDDFLCRIVRSALASGTEALEASKGGARDYIYMHDVIDAVEAIALRGSESIYNVASGTLLSNDELANLIMSELNVKINLSEGESVRPPLLDVSRLKREFGIIPRPPALVLRGILRNLGSALPR